MRCRKYEREDLKGCKAFWCFFPTGFCYMMSFDFARNIFSAERSSAFQPPEDFSKSSKGNLAESSGADPDKPQAIGKPLCEANRKPVA